jgi:hypothetical protein
MTAPEKCVIFRYTYHCPGIGDFLRAAVGVYLLCKERNVPFYFDITHPIGKWLEWKKYPGDISDFKEDTYRYNTDGTTSISIYDASQHIFKYDKHVVSTNYLFSDYNILAIFMPTLRGLLYPTPEFEADYRKCIDIPDRSYICIHIRYGDCVLIRKGHHDDRIAYSDTPINERIERCIAAIKDKSQPVYLITDNYDQKMELSAKYGFKYTDIRPVHTSYNIREDLEYRDTLIEFMFISRAAHVYGLSQSGFSQWGAAYGGVPYTLIE